jgi:DNA-binding MarR family transcriptional regulator
MNIRRLVQERMRDTGHGNFFSMSQLEILRYVAEKKNPLMKEVAEHLKIMPPSATVLIDGLAKSGKIRRIADEQDRRLVRLAITNKGRLCLKKGLQKMKSEMQKVFTKLTKKEINNLITIYDKLAKILQKK